MMNLLFLNKKAATLFIISLGLSCISPLCAQFDPDPECYYKIISKRHFCDEGVLDAETHGDYVYRSHFNSNNTKWRFEREVSGSTGTPTGYYTIINMYHEDKNHPAKLAVEGDRTIARSNRTTNNTKWRFELRETEGSITYYTLISKSLFFSTSFLATISMDEKRQSLKMVDNPENEDDIEWVFFKVNE
ncbi:MAG: hypothetical protein K2P93_04970 [Alphaproteobacteria bacterium]|nr:hypothetical protein [Alphaproteobacteria bacterium]